MTDASDDVTELREIKAWFEQNGYHLLGPHQPGETEEVRRRAGWFAPFVRHDLRTGSAAYGWGETPTAAARDAQAKLTSKAASS